MVTAVWDTNNKKTSKECTFSFNFYQLYMKTSLKNLETNFFQLKWFENYCEFKKSVSFY